MNRDEPMTRTPNEAPATTRGRASSRAWLALVAVVATASAFAAYRAAGSEPERTAARGARPAAAEDGRVIVRPDAARRLGLSVASVEEREVTRLSLRTAAVEVPDDRRAVVAAPLAGWLSSNGPALRPGERVAAGQVLAVLELGEDRGGAPLLLSDRVALLRARGDLEAQHADAAGRARAAGAALEAATSALDRAVALEQDEVGSARRVEEARAAVAAASATATAADAAAASLLRALDALDGLGAGAVTSVASPIDGEVWTVSAQPGQAVAAGAVLAEIVDRSRPWLRVPLFHTELERFADATELRLGPDRPGATRAVRVRGAGRADPASGRVDLVFAIEDDVDPGPLVPGQLVPVWLPEPSAKRTVVPRAALLHDEAGRTFVYVRAEEGGYRRARVEVDGAVDADGDADLMALRAGPEVGAEVVTEGAAELFGVESGAGG